MLLLLIMMISFTRTQDQVSTQLRARLTLPLNLWPSLLAFLSV